jgi:hypothetical protein
MSVMELDGNEGKEGNRELACADGAPLHLHDVDQAFAAHRCFEKVAAKDYNCTEDQGSWRNDPDDQPRRERGKRTATNLTSTTSGVILGPSTAVHTCGEQK